MTQFRRYYVSYLNTPNFLKIVIECWLFLPWLFLFLILEKDQQTLLLFLEFCRVSTLKQVDLCIPTWAVINPVDVHFHCKFSIGTKFLLDNGTGSLINCWTSKGIDGIKRLACPNDKQPFCNSTWFRKLLSLLRELRRLASFPSSRWCAANQNWTSSCAGPSSVAPSTRTFMACKAPSLFPLCLNVLSWRSAETSSGFPGRVRQKASLDQPPDGMRVFVSSLGPGI